MEGELGPEQGAERYARELSEHVGTRDGDLPVLDVIVLGIGPDGHVASLFPGAPALDAGEHALCVAVHDSPKPPPERITLSMAVLRAARRCELLATSAAKADAIARDARRADQARPREPAAAEQAERDRRRRGRPRQPSARAPQMGASQPVNRELLMASIATATRSMPHHRARRSRRWPRSIKRASARSRWWRTSATTS